MPYLTPDPKPGRKLRKFDAIVRDMIIGADSNGFGNVYDGLPPQRMYRTIVRIQTGNNMKPRKFVALWVACLLCVSSSVSAAEKDEDLLAEIAPLLTDRHYVVIRVHVAAVDLDAAVKELDAAIVKADGEKLSTEEVYLNFKQRKADFTKAGGKTIYVIVDDVTYTATRDDGNGGGASTGMSGAPLVIVPLDKQANPAALAKAFDMTLIKAGPAATDFDERLQWVARVHTGLLLIGMRMVVDHAIAADSTDRPDVAKALAAAGDAPVAVAVVIPQKVRKVVDQIPNLPEEFGGGATAPLGQVSWIGLGVNVTAKMPLTLTIKCESTKTARDLKALIDTTLKAVDALFAEQAAEKSPAAAMRMSFMGMALMLGKELNLQARADTVVGSLSEKGKTAVMDRLSTLVIEMRSAAKMASSSMRINQICMAIAIHSASNNDTFPPDLGALVKADILKADGLDNPRMPDRKPGYVYVKPTKKADDKAYYGNYNRIVLMYENYDKWPEGGIAVGYLDFHVDTVKTEAEFKKLLDATKAANK